MGEINQSLMTIFQISVSLVVFYIIIKSIIRFSRKDISFWFLFLWLIVWLIVLLINFFPMSVTWVANFVGIGRGVDLITYCALIIAFYLIFKQNIRLRILEKKVAKLVSNLAIKNVKKK